MSDDLYADRMARILSDTLEESLKAQIERFGIGRHGDTVTFCSAIGAGAPASPAPPPAFTAARARVAQWIAPAPDQAFDDIVGLDDALGRLRDAIAAPATHPALYAAYGMKAPYGALLCGPPGCGKTMFARAAAAEMRRLYGEATEFVSIAGAELQSPYVGVTENHIKAIFDFAREYFSYRGHPLLVFIDEADALFPDRTGRARPVYPWEQSQVATFLAEMDGMRTNGAFVLLASNRPEALDQALLREGRCDVKITVPRPGREAARAILAKAFAGARVGPEGVETLVTVALEALFDPHRVLIDAAALRLDDGVAGKVRRRHFLLEHILSGAMVASVPRRAAARAFARDKADGIVRGVQTADVIAAVGDIYEENRRLDHGFALAEFTRTFVEDLAAEPPPAPRGAKRRS